MNENSLIYCISNRRPNSQYGRRIRGKALLKHWGYRYRQYFLAPSVSLQVISSQRDIIFPPSSSFPILMELIWKKNFCILVNLWLNGCIDLCTWIMSAAETILDLLFLAGGTCTTFRQNVQQHHLLHSVIYHGCRIGPHHCHCHQLIQRCQVTEDFSHQSLDVHIQNRFYCY